MQYQLYNSRKFEEYKARLGRVAATNTNEYEYTHPFFRLWMQHSPAIMINLDTPWLMLRAMWPDQVAAPDVVIIPLPVRNS